MKYNLTFWQRLSLIPIWFIWIGYEPGRRKSWHEVKKGMEKHAHKFTQPTEDGYFSCEHEGCNIISVYRYES